ncbi:MAG: Fic family protein [Rhodospirillaceae bacterium]
MKRDDLCDAVRRRLRRLPDPFAAHYGVVPLPPPEDSLDLRPVRLQCEQAQAAMVRADVLAATLPDPWLVSRVLTRREAVASSSIEGTNSTLDELLTVEETADDAATDAARQVRDYALALDTLLPEARAQGPSLFTMELVCRLHRLVMADDPDYSDVPGEFRRRVVWIGGRDIAYSTFNPPPPDDVPSCLEETMDYMRCSGMQAVTQSLLTRMAVAHAHFEAVHPFRDGNGRVGRLLLPLSMAADSHIPLYLSPYIDAHRNAYNDALKAAQQRLELAAIVAFMADAVVGTVDELQATATALTALQALWRQRRKFRGGSTALRALAMLPHYPVVTVSRLSAVLGVSFHSASQAVGSLVDAGILTERTGYTRNRIFSAPEVLSVLNRPFSAEPILPDAR